MSSAPVKHLEIEAYTLHGVRVIVEIDYDKETISLLEQPQRNAIKKWVFADRALEFMQGWRNILAAMEYAIDEAEKKLDRHVRTKEKDKAKIDRAVMRGIQKQGI